MKFLVDLEDLHAELKKFCKEHGYTMRGFVIKAIKNQMKAEK